MKVVFAAAVEFDVAAAAVCEDCTELTAGVSMGDTGAGIVFLLVLGEK